MDAVFNAYALTVKHHSLLLERLQKRFDALEEANTELVKGNSAKDNRIDELVQENSKKDARIDDLEKRMNEMQRKIGTEDSNICHITVRAKPLLHISIIKLVPAGLLCTC